MRPTHSTAPALMHSVVAILATRQAPLLIALGLVLLFAQFTVPIAPVATGFALIALGATLEITRPGRANLSRLGIACYFLVYAGLYLLLIGAVCDAAARGLNGGLSQIQVIDLAASAAAMAFATRHCVAAIVAYGNSPPR